MAWFIDKTSDQKFFKNAALDVIRWNWTANQGNHEFTPERCEAQWNLVEEEFKELKEAFEKKDKAEFLKEMCDLFVVLSYYCYLSTSGDEDGLSPLLETEFVENVDRGLDQIEEAFKRGYILIGFDYVCNMISVLHADWREALTSVLVNNWCKYLTVPLLDALSITPEQMAAAIETNSGGRYKNVVPVVFGGCVIFRDGNGKMMKPTTYQPVSGFDKLIY